MRTKGIVAVRKRYGVSLQTIVKWCENGCPHEEGYKGIKKVKLFNMAEVDEWVKAQRSIKR